MANNHALLHINTESEETTVETIIRVFRAALYIAKMNILFWLRKSN
jgi:hypothetical protein